MLEVIREPLLARITTSKKWFDEAKAGLAASNYISILLPKDKHDAFFIARLGYKESFNITQYLCFKQAHNPGTTYA
jgi:hypothetical protein